jgi:hypothetical protein
MKKVLLTRYFLIGVLIFLAPLVEAQNSGSGGKAAAPPPESILSQVEKLELSAKKSLATPVEVFTELNKDLPSGLTALRGAVNRLDAAIARIKSESVFLDECARCSEQLQKQKRNLVALQGQDVGEELQQLMLKAQELEGRLEQAKRVAKTSLSAMDTAKTKVESWQKVYSHFEGAFGREEAVANIRQKVAAELGNSPKLN